LAPTASAIVVRSKHGAGRVGHLREHPADLAGSSPPRSPRQRTVRRSWRGAAEGRSDRPRCAGLRRTKSCPPAAKAHNHRLFRAVDATRPRGAFRSSRTLLRGELLRDRFWLLGDVPDEGRLSRAAAWPAPPGPAARTWLFGKSCQQSLYTVTKKVAAPTTRFETIVSL